jgi:hypothetical protein
LERKISEWVHEKGWGVRESTGAISMITNHLAQELVRKKFYICIYKMEELWHDPSRYIVNFDEKYFQYLEKKVKTCFKAKNEEY